MKGIREIRHRIKAVKNTSQITRAMQLVAASKMKRAQNKAKRGRPYAFHLAEILNALVKSLIRSGEEITHPLLEERVVKNRGILVISTDKGLCGPLNANLLRLIGEKVSRNAKFVAVGRKGAQFLSRTHRDFIAAFTVSDHCTFAEVRDIVEFLINAYLEKKIDTLEVVFPRFVNTLFQESRLVKLLPMQGLEEELVGIRERLKIDMDAASKDGRELVFEPSQKMILAELPAVFIKHQVYHLMLEAKASEHSARMVAMKSATDNAKKMVESLSLEYNKARQAAITQEILEIAAASAA